MCNLYNLRVAKLEFNSYFQAQDDWRQQLLVEKDYVAPDKPGYVVRDVDGQRTLSVMRWGFPPPKNADKSVVNCRNIESPFWRGALTKPERHCLVPATSFSEWSVKVPGEKQKLHWFNVPSRPIFGMAGIWRPTDSGDTYAFLTADPNGLVGAIHPKAMPVILLEDDWDAWLAGDFSAVVQLAQPFPSQLMAIVDDPRGS